MLEKYFTSQAFWGLSMFADNLHTPDLLCGSSHGFGSAAVAAGDVDLLPFCLVTYILMGAVCSVAVNVPLIHTSVLQL